MLLIVCFSWSFVIYNSIKIITTISKLSTPTSQKIKFWFSIFAFYCCAGLFLFEVCTNSEYEQNKYKLMLFTSLLIIPLMLTMLDFLRFGTSLVHKQVSK